MAAGYLSHLGGDRVTVLSAGSAVQESDVVITMGCGDTCPIFPGTRYEDWQLDDPAGQGIDAVRPIRDDIKGRVQTLLSELVPADS
jgi:protein-tyrosine-phosphatase